MDEAKKIAKGIRQIAEREGATREQADMLESLVKMGINMGDAIKKEAERKARN